MDLLLEPAGTPECEALIAALERSLAGTSVWVATWLPSKGRSLQRAVFSSDRTLLFASSSLNQEELAPVRTSFGPGLYGDIFFEQLIPPQRLFIFGAGDDAKPLVSVAGILGWTVTVADGRAQLARSERFPAAQQVLGSTSVIGLGIAPEDAIVLMTHSYEQDRDLLAAVLPLSPRYIGLLGSRHRSSLLVRDASIATGMAIADCCECLYTPIGLSLGGDGAEAIGLAVVAEIQACFQGQVPTSRHLTEAEISVQIASGSEARYLQVQCAL